MQSPDSKEELSRGERELCISSDSKNPFLDNKWVNKTKKKPKQQNEDMEEEEVQSEKQLDQNKLKTIPSYPLERWGHQSIMVGQYLYLIGGYIEDPRQQAKEQIYRLDCETYDWEKVVCTSPQIPEHRDSHSLCLIQGKIFLFGGKTPDPNEKVKNDLWVFDPTKNKHEWKRIDAAGIIPSPRESHQTCDLDDRYMVVFGGTNGKEDENIIIYDDMYIFDSQNNVWREVLNKHGSQIEARDSFSMTFVNGFIYIFGGQGKSVGQDDVFYNDFYKLKFNILNEGKSETVEVLPVISQNEERKPCARASHSMCVFKDRYIFIIAGEKGEDSKLDDIWAYDTEENIWIEIPHKKQRHPLLKPIISHSSSVYKDQIIIFGGLMKDNNSHSDQTLVLQLNYVEDSKISQYNSQELKNTCKNCQVVYNLTDEQKEKQKQLEQSLKCHYFDDEENIRIDVDRERDVQMKHPEVFDQEIKNDDGLAPIDTELEQMSQSSKKINQPSKLIQSSDNLKAENSRNDETIDKTQSIIISENLNKEQIKQLDERDIKDDEYAESNNINEMDLEKDIINIVKKDENDVDDEQDKEQLSVKEESNQEEKTFINGVKQDQYEFEVKDDSVLESEEKLRQQEREAQKNKAKKEIAAQSNLHHQVHEECILNIRQPYISMSFLNSISNLIGHPFAAFGLLVQNAKSQFASTIQINLMCLKKKETYINTVVNKQVAGVNSGQEGNSSQASNKVNGYNINQPIDKNIIDNYNVFLQFYDDSEGFPHSDFVDIMYKFDTYKTVQYNKAHKELIQDEIQSQTKAQYGNNIKMAGLRLGQNVLFISKNKTYNILNVGLISTNGKINPNLQECIIFLFSIDMMKKVYLTESGDQNKRIILNNIAHMMNEEQLFKHDKGNHIYIFDLKRIPSVNRDGYEFSYNHTNPDIVTKKKTLFKEKKDQVEKLIDYSLKSYLKHMYAKVPDNMHFCINGQRNDFISYQDVLKRQKGMRFLKELTVDSYPMVKESGIVTIYEQTNYNQEQPQPVQPQKEVIEKNASDFESSNNEVKEGTTTRKNSLVEQHQGILIYQDDRLIGRAESNHFGSYFIDKILNKTKNQQSLFKYVGTIELDKFFQPNLFYTGLDNSFQEATIRQSLKQFLKQQKQAVQKSDKIRSRSSENIEEPDLRKEIKTD